MNYEPKLIYPTEKLPLPKQLDALMVAMLPIVKHFHSRFMLAPHATSMDRRGKVTNRAITVEEGTQNITVEYAINHFENSFRKAALAKEISACAVFYHGTGTADPARTAQTEDEARAIIGLLEHKSGRSVYLVVPYIIAAGRIHYEAARLIDKPAKVFVEQASRPKRWWRFW